VSELKPAQLLSFGGLDNLVADTGIFSNDTDGLARALHNRYRQYAPKDGQANVPWEQLSEDFRDSNRRQLVHIPAKLSSAGVELESWLRSADKNPQTATLPGGGDLLADEALIEKLAILEHERWMADRRINGWRYGIKKTPEKRLHSDLVPYEDLSAASQSYDRLVIETLGKALQQDKYTTAS
jgi:RyR domain-containing protein